jgi:hypothetical protein
LSQRWVLGLWIYCHRSKTRSRTSSQPLYFRWLALFRDVCLRQSAHCLDGKYDVCFSSAFTFYFVLVVFHDFEKLVSRISASSVNADSINQISKSDAIVILGSSLSVLWPILIQTVFGLMRKQKCTLWLLYLYLYFWLGLRWEQEMDSPRGNRWLLVISLLLSFGFTLYY